MDNFFYFVNRRYLCKQKVNWKQKMKSHVTVTEYKASTDKIPFLSC